MLPYLPPELWWAILYWCDIWNENYDPLVLLIALLQVRSGRVLPQPLPAMDAHTLLVRGHYAYCAKRWKHWRDRTTTLRQSLGDIAAAHGHLPTMLRYPPKSITVSMRDAALSGHIDIVRQCQVWGARNYESAASAAAYQGHVDIVCQLKEWGASNYNKMMCSAAAGCGHANIVQQCQIWGADDFEEAMFEAARSGHLDIVQQCQAWGARDYEGAMYSAVQGGHIDIVRQCQAWGARDYDTIRTMAVNAGFDEIVQQVDDWVLNSV